MKNSSLSRKQDNNISQKIELFLEILQHKDSNILKEQRIVASN